MLLVGCGSTPKGQALAGRTLGDIRSLMPGQLFVIYDLSAPVLDMPPSYDDGQSQEAWTVVAACGVRSDIEVSAVPVGVIPTDALTDELNTRADRGEFDSLLAECAPGG